MTPTGTRSISGNRFARDAAKKPGRERGKKYVCEPPRADLRSVGNGVRRSFPTQIEAAASGGPGHRNAFRSGNVGELSGARPCSLSPRAARTG
jgi:hypothetical protein